MTEKQQKGSPASCVFREQEIKINVPDCRTLDAVSHHLLTDPHYQSKTAPERIPDILEGLSFRPAQTETPLRVRFYYDDLAGTAYRNGIEIRLEPKKQQNGVWVFEQTVKVTEAASDAAHTMLDRTEYKDTVRDDIPSLKSLPREVKERLKAIFNTGKTKDIHLYPLLMTMGQRWKMCAYPEGGKGAIVEYATDRARGFVAGSDFQWDILQIEMELKKGGSDALLADERERLTTMFNNLSIETRSKPSQGFDFLENLDGGQKKALKQKLCLADSPFAVFPVALSIYS